MKISRPKVDLMECKFRKVENREDELVETENNSVPNANFFSFKCKSDTNFGTWEQLLSEIEGATRI